MGSKNTLRRHKTTSYTVFPHEKADFKRKTFSRISDAEKYIRKQADFHGHGAIIRKNVDLRGSSGSEREWMMYFDMHLYSKHGIAKLNRYQLPFRGSKYIHKSLTSKDRKLYFAFSDKIINLMCFIGDSAEESDYMESKLFTSNLVNLLKLFNKRFKYDKEDFKTFVEYALQYDDSEMQYGSVTSWVDGYKNGNDSFKSIVNDRFWYWSDRCGFDRTIILIQTIQHFRPDVVEKFLKKDVN